LILADNLIEKVAGLSVIAFRAIDAGDGGTEGEKVIHCYFSIQKSLEMESQITLEGPNRDSLHEGELSSTHLTQSRYIF